MKQLIILITLIIVMGGNSACKKSSSQLCGGNNPDKNLPWLKKEIEDLSSSPFCSSISRSTYKNQTVFILSNCDPNVDSIPFIFDCNGNKLNLTTEEYRNLNFTGSIELIWKNK